MLPKKNAANRLDVSPRLYHIVIVKSPAGMKPDSQSLTADILGVGLIQRATSLKYLPQDKPRDSKGSITFLECLENCNQTPVYVKLLSFIRIQYTSYLFIRIGTNHANI